MLKTLLIMPFAFAAFLIFDVRSFRRSGEKTDRYYIVIFSLAAALTAAKAFELFPISLYKYLLLLCKG